MGGIVQPSMHRLNESIAIGSTDAWKFQIGIMLFGVLMEVLSLVVAL